MQNYSVVKLWISNYEKRKLVNIILVVLIVTAFIAYVKDTVCIKNVELLIVMANPIFW